MTLAIDPAAEHLRSALHAGAPATGMEDRRRSERSDHDGVPVAHDGPARSAHPVRHDRTSDLSRTDRGLVGPAPAVAARTRGPAGRAGRPVRAGRDTSRLSCAIPPVAVCEYAPECNTDVHTRVRGGPHVRRSTGPTTDAPPTHAVGDSRDRRRC